MQQIQAVWGALTPRRRFVVLLATVAMFAAVLGLARIATAPGMELLYSGLESGPAGEVVQALEARGVPYEVRGGTILVPDAQRDELRMLLASEGLPANSARGYELLDSLSGFGTTSQMFDAAYWRAKEGELARTIQSVPGIASARVHIANTGSNPFQRNVRPTASVTITTRGIPLPLAQARALKFLVASAVAGMSPDDVAVIDSEGGLIAPAEESAPAEALGEERAALLRERALRLLEARVGRGNAVVEVSVETVTEAETILEKRFDPDGRVAISTDSEERTGRSQDSGGGVTVASNLPDGDAASGEESSRQENETRERVNYEVSETQREVTRVPGAIRRLSVAVLVNGTVARDADGQPEFTPRPDEELEALRGLVASAVGYDETRGDAITLQSMSFEPAPLPEPAADPGLFQRLQFDAM
ncbi:MAG: flagellar basal-body MS-ring/collar protein FliF, partial [Paracoccaceae bacterium]